jgi:hypothetical protein
VDPSTGLPGRAVILDHAGCAVDHGLPQDEREFDLAATSTRKLVRGGVKPAPRAKVCSQCQTVLPPATRSCTCGFAFPPSGPVPEEVGGDLVELPPAEVAQRHWERLREEGAARGYKPGWAYHRFVETFHMDPPRRFRARRAPASDSPKEKPRAAAVRVTVSAAEAATTPDCVVTPHQLELGQMPLAPVPSEPSAPPPCATPASPPEARSTPSSSELVEWDL